MKISKKQLVRHTGKEVKRTVNKLKDKELEDVVLIGSGETGKPEFNLPSSGEVEKTCKMGEALTGGTLTGNIRIHRKFHSNFLNNDRDILVYLPPGYSKENNKKYPVLYLQDGQNMFNRDTSHCGEWGVDEAAERLIREGKIKDIIMVAIYNNKDRMSEYTPVKDPEYGGGNLDKYADFVTKELKPFIDKTYKTSTEAKDTGILGSSLGGLSSLYMGWEMPYIFGITGVISPSLWWSDEYLIKEIENDSQTEGPSKIWLDMGTAEGGGTDNNNNNIPDVLDNSRAMGEVLLRKGYSLGDELFYHEEHGAGHNEWAWSQRIDKVLKYLFEK